jgi:deoxycytidine triphosphate deaminase
VLSGFEGRLEGYAVAEKHVLDSGAVKLDRLRPYLVITCEEVNAPSQLMFHIAPRSSLFRLTQSVLGCSFGEAGYRGFLTFMLLPFADSEIELGARFAQLSFSELKGEAQYAEQKESNYQGGRLF